MNADQYASITREIEKLSDLTVNELREKWVEVWNEPCRSRNKDYLRKRIAWRIQARAFGGLSERALRRAEELADETLLRVLPPRKAPATKSPGDTINEGFVIENPTIPMPGSVITKKYQGRKLVVTVEENGFKYKGQIYRSLSAVAKAVTGTHWNGRAFFGFKNSKEVAA
jgi:hypothetical protein